jgi:hypothetical protein
MAEPPIKGKTVAETEKNWHAVEKNHRAADLDQLLAEPWPGLLEHVLKRALALAARPMDARVTAVFIPLLDRMEYVGPKSRKLWEPVIRYLGRSGDPAALALLERMRATGTSFSYRYIMEGMLDTAIKKMRKDGVVPAAAPAATAAPVGEAARQVLADELVEKGDPRGEFIALQSAPATKESLARQRGLLKQHEKKWLGQLAGLLVKDQTVWERGYPVKLVFADKRGLIERATGAPELATVRWLALQHGLGKELATFLTHDVLKGLRALHGLHGFQLEALFEHASGQMTHIEELVGDSRKELQPKLHAEFPKLRVLGVEGYYGPEITADLKAPIWQQIERLVIGSGNELHEWLGPIRKLKSLRTLQVGGSWRYPSSFTLDLETRVAELVINKGGFRMRAGGGEGRDQDDPRPGGPRHARP